MRKVGYSGNVERDMKNTISALNELVDNLTPKANPRSSTEDGIRIYRTEDKNAVIAAQIDDVWYQTLMTPTSKQGRNKELAPKAVFRSKTITASSDAIDVKNVSVLYVDVSTLGSNLLIGGFTGGTNDQVLFVVATDESGGGGGGDKVHIENDEGTGNQDIQTSTGADLEIQGGGAVLVYKRSTNLWYEISHSL